MAYKDLFEEAIRKAGGCGISQWIVCVIMHASKIVLTFSTITMAFAGYNPGFICESMLIEREKIDKMDIEDVSAEGLCIIDEAAQCNSYFFYTSMSTTVSQWDLVCRYKWIVALITSLQMVGVLFGCLLSSCIADYIGPKLTYFSGLVIVIIFNFIGIYSTYVEVYVLIRIIIGLGIGMSVTVQFPLMIEYIPAKLVPVVSAVPSVSIAACLFSPVAWWLRDWKMIHLFIAVAGLPSLLSFWFVPESFRWQMIKYKQASAARTFRIITWINRKEKSDVNYLLTEAVTELADYKNERNLVGLYKTKYTCGLTIGLFFAWFAVGYTYFGTIFGVDALQGNLFLNLLLITVIDAPLVALTGPLVNWFGRKKYGICSMVVSGMCGIIVGILQYTHFFEFRLITTLALICKMTGTSVWIVLMTYTMEVYPSGIRAFAYGFHYTGSLLGGVVAPLIINANDKLPGLLYFISGIMMVLSAVCFCFFRECRDLGLEEPVIEKDEAPDVDITATRRINRVKHWSTSSMEIP